MIEPWELLVRAVGRPEPFAPHDAPFWDDPHIGAGMLAAHLDPTTDAASRRPATIRATVTHLVDALKLDAGAKLLDLGCGPGLYATELARRGIRVTGVDLSPGSIAYARERAQADGLEIGYRLGDYTTMDLGGPFDAAILVYLDFGVLPDEPRNRLLDAIHGALRPGGMLAFDAYTPARRRVPDGQVRVAWEDGGFWRPHRHLLVETSYRYDGHLDLDQHAVIDNAGLTVYRVWDRAYGVRELRSLLGRHGFVLAERWSDLTGTPWRRRSPTVAIAARRIGS